MNVTDAVAMRFSARDFTQEAVPQRIIKSVLEKALRSPSGGNLQPWHIHVVEKEALAQLKADIQEKIAMGHKEELEYSVYPQNIPSPYNERRKEVGEDMYGTMDIPKTDKISRRKWFQRNFEFFGAPIALFFSVNKCMGSPQWADIGMLLQTIMLLLREEGIDSCAQECWSVYPTTLRQFLNLPNDRMFFCGMAVGYANQDHPVNQFRSKRASLDEIVTFMH